MAGGGCDAVVGCLSPGFSCQTQTCAHSIMIWWMTMPAFGPRPLWVHISLTALSIFSGWQARCLSGAGSESLRSGVIIIRLRRIGFGCAGFVLKFLGACSGQAEVVRHIKIGFGCNGLGLHPLWSSRSTCSFDTFSRSSSVLHPMVLTKKVATSSSKPSSLLDACM